MRRFALTLLLVALAVALPAATAGAAPRIVVAVVDGGVDLRHPALRAAAWHNPSEIAGNRVDDDADGVIDNVHGVDLVDGDGDASDPRGHGTHVAGLIGARSARVNGARGVALMAIRVADRRGRAYGSTAAAGILWAAANGARIINVSLGYFSETDAPELKAAIDTAGQAGVLVVVSAGNGGEDLDHTPSFPASLDAPNLVSVGAPGVSWSAHGSAVDLLVPGGEVVSTLPNRRYGYRAGTSQSAALASRAAAAIARAHPALDAAGIRVALIARGTATTRSPTPSLSRAQLKSLTR